MGGRGNSAKQAPSPPEEADAARKRFGNAKSISSSQFNSEDDQSGNNYEKEVRAVCIWNTHCAIYVQVPFKLYQPALSESKKQERWFSGDSSPLAAKCA